MTTDVAASTVGGMGCQGRSWISMYLETCAFGMRTVEISAVAIDQARVVRDCVDMKGIGSYVPGQDRRQRGLSAR